MTVDELLRELAIIKDEYKGGNFVVEIYVESGVSTGPIEVTSADVDPRAKVVELA